MSRYASEIVRRICTSPLLRFSSFTTRGALHPDHNLPFSLENNHLRVSRLTWRGLFTISPSFASRFFELPDHDVLWLPVPTTPGPKGKKASVVLTVHDIGPVAAPHLFPALARIRWKRYLECQLRLADRVIVPSHFTKEEMIAHLRVSAEMVTVIQHGFSHVDSVCSFAECPRRSGSEDTPNILYVGQLSPKKNTDTMVDAFSRIQSRGDSFTFTLVGEPYNLAKKTLGQLDKLKDTGKTHMLRRVSSGELSRLYRSADIVVCPSRYEGFGLPVLEAMAFGKPVICSSIPVFKEVAGDGAFYFEPESPDSLVNRIDMVLDSPELRESKRVAASNRLKLFSWDHAASAHIQVFQELL